jgi:hypothetical protein
LRYFSKKTGLLTKGIVIILPIRPAGNYGKGETMRSGSHAAILCSLLVWAPALAQDGALPNLVGTWRGERTTYFKEGQRQATEELRIMEQNGAYFRATKIWEHVEKDSEPMGHVGERGVHQASEPMLGVIDFDGETIHIVEHADWGQFHGRLVDRDTIEGVLMESGPHAVIYRVVLMRAL